MTDNDTPQHEAESAAAGAPQDAAPESARAAAGGVEEALREELAAVKDKALRVLAEMENLRRRTEKEVADARAYGAQKFAGDMLTFADNIQRAIESTPKDLEGPAKSLLEGLSVMAADFQSRLARHGVKKMAPEGARFDPNQHEALFEAHDESKPAGSVAQVVEDGYTIGDRVLRPAKVGVTRGGPKA